MFRQTLWHKKTLKKPVSKVQNSLSLYPSASSLPSFLFPFHPTWWAIHDEHRVALTYSVVGKSFDLWFFRLRRSRSLDEVGEFTCANFAN